MGKTCLLNIDFGQLTSWNQQELDSSVISLTLQNEPKNPKPNKETELFMLHIFSATSHPFHPFSPTSKNKQTPFPFWKAYQVVISLKNNHLLLPEESSGWTMELGCSWLTGIVLRLLNHFKVSTTSKLWRDPTDRSRFFLFFLRSRKGVREV